MSNIGKLAAIRPTFNVLAQAIDKWAPQTAFVTITAERVQIVWLLVRPMYCLDEKIMAANRFVGPFSVA